MEVASKKASLVRKSEFSDPDDFDDFIDEFAQFVARRLDEGGKGVVILYPSKTGPSGEARRLTDLLKNLLEENEQSLGDYEFLEGGSEEKTRYEFWLVPPGGASPKPNPTK